MAELHVQPKKTGGIWLWLLLVIIALVIIFLLLKSCGNTADNVGNNRSDSSSQGTVAATTPGTHEIAPGNKINFNSPQTTYEEITDQDINVRGTNDYAIYSLGENILFDVDKSSIRSDAVSKLKQISSSLGKRYAAGTIEIYGHTDSTGDRSHNKQLSEDRAKAVRDWLLQNGSLKEDHISLHGVGESDPVATNATEEGKQENRSVQIVARKS